MSEDIEEDFNPRLRWMEENNESRWEILYADDALRRRLRKQQQEKLRPVYVSEKDQILRFLQLNFTNEEIAKAMCMKVVTLQWKMEHYGIKTSVQ